MPNSYSWVVTQIECYPLQGGHKDVVFAIHWRRQATDGLHSADVYGSQNVVLKDTSSFTPYADLTFAQVCGWLEDAMGAEHIAQIDAYLAQQIADLANPSVTVAPLPWGDA